MGDNLSLLSVIFNRYKNERGAPERARLEKEFADTLRAAKMERDYLLTQLTSAVNVGNKQAENEEGSPAPEVFGEITKEIGEAPTKKYKKGK